MVKFKISATNSCTASRPKLPLVNLTIMRSINEKAELLVLLNYLSSTTGNRRWRNSVGHRLGAESVPSLKIATLIWSRSYNTDNHWEKPCQFFGFLVFFFFAFSQTSQLVILNRSLLGRICSASHLLSLATREGGRGSSEKPGGKPEVRNIRGRDRQPRRLSQDQSLGNAWPCDSQLHPDHVRPPAHPGQDPRNAKISAGFDAI